MKFFLGSGILFQHIPRTGGTYVERVLDELKFRQDRFGWTCRDGRVRTARSHSLIGHYVRAKRVPKIERAFTFIRHPVSYYEAVHRFLKWKGPGNREVHQTSWHPLFHAVRLYDSDFETWVNRMIRDQGNWVTRLYESVIGPDGGEFVDYVGRTETLKDDLDTILKEFFGVAKSLPDERIYSVGKRQKVSDNLSQTIVGNEIIAVRRWYNGKSESTKQNFSNCIEYQRRFGWLRDGSYVQ